MAIEFFTGFEGCVDDEYHLQSLFDDSTDLGRLYPTAGYNNSVGFGLSTSLAKNVTPATTKALGMHLKGSLICDYSTIIGRSICLFAMADETTFRFMNTSSGITVYKDAVEIATCTTNMSSTMSHFEAKLVSHASGGSIQIKLNGALILNESGLNTTGSNIIKVWWCPSGTSNTGYMDNLYVADDFQGELYSVLLQPSSDGVVNFTPATGTDNYAMIDEAQNDADTTYVESDTITHQDLYGYTDLHVNLIPLSATLVTVARKNGTGFRSLQSISKQDATEYTESVDTVLSSIYPNANDHQSLINVRSLAPDGTAWTREKINAMQWGFKVTG